MGKELLDYWIGRRDPLTWPARSADLTPLDFFIWGHVKNNAFRTQCTSLTLLERRVSSTIRIVPTDKLQN